MFKKLKKQIKKLASEPDEGKNRRQDSDDSTDNMDPEMLLYIQRLAADPSIPRSNLDDQLVRRHQDYLRLKQLVATQ